jgi:hypothetical protein
LSHHAAEHARGLNDPSIGNLLIEARAYDAPFIPLMRGDIFFCDLADRALSSALVICSCAVTRRVDEQVRELLSRSPRCDPSRRRFLP